MKFYGVLALFLLVLAPILGFNMPSREEQLANDPKLAEICDSSDTSWKNVNHQVIACNERSKALLSIQEREDFKAKMHPNG